MSVSRTTRSGHLPHGDFKLCKSVEKAFTRGKTARIASPCCVSCECSPELKRITAPLFSVGPDLQEAHSLQSPGARQRFLRRRFTLPTTVERGRCHCCHVAGRSPAVSEMTLLSAAPCVCPQSHSWHVAEPEAESSTVPSSSSPAAPGRARPPPDLAVPLRDTCTSLSLRVPTRHGELL